VQNPTTFKIWPPSHRQGDPPRWWFRTRWRSADRCGRAAAKQVRDLRQPGGRRSTWVHGDGSMPTAAGDADPAKDQVPCDVWDRLIGEPKPGQ